jgi:hypothetical protein
MTTPRLNYSFLKFLRLQVWAFYRQRREIGIGRATAARAAWWQMKELLAVRRGELE